MRTYWAFRIGSLLLVRLPLDVALRLAESVAGLAFLFSGRLRANVISNLRHVFGPGEPEVRLRSIARGVFRTGAKNYVELLRMPAFTADDIRRRIRPHGLERIDEALAKGRGAILISAHFGSFESTAQILALNNYRLLVPVEPISPPELLNLVSRLRAFNGIEFIPSDRSAMRPMVRWLRGNGIVGFVVDRDAIGTGLPFEFFGTPTPIPPAAVVMARRERCPVIPALAVRRADNTSDIYVEPLIEMQVTDDEEADLQVNMRRVLEIVEQYIRRYPDQWVAFVPVWNGIGSQDARSTAKVEPREPVGQGRSSYS